MTRSSHSHSHSHTHSHSHLGPDHSLRSIAIAFAVTAVFAVIEAVGGAVSGSLALSSDAAHMGTDLLGLGISWFALWWGNRAQKKKFERLGALVSIALIWFTAGTLAYSAWTRLQRGEMPIIQGGLAFAVSTLGLLANLISLNALRRGKDHQINVRAAYLHVATDLAGSVGAILSATIVIFTGWGWADVWITFVLIAGILWSSWSFLASRVLRH